MEVTMGAYAAEPQVDGDVESTVAKCQAAIDTESTITPDFSESSGPDESNSSPSDTKKHADAELDSSRRLAWWQASLTLTVVIIGAGVLALPALTMQGGIVLSLVALMVCGMAVTESGMAMWKGFMAGNSQLSEGNMMVSYEDFGREAFGRYGETLVIVGLLCLVLGLVAAYGVLIAGSLADLFPGVMTSKNWLLALSPAIALLSLLPNVSAVAKVVPVAAVCVIVLVNIIVFKSVFDGHRWQNWPDLDESQLFQLWPSSTLDMGTVVASLLGAFSAVSNVPSVLCEMKDPKEFPKAWKVTITAVSIIYVIVMCAGYYGYGAFMQPNIVLSMSSFPANQQQAMETPFEDWTGPKCMIVRVICSTLIVVKLAIALPLNMMVIFYSFQTFEYTKDCVPVGSAANKVMRLAVVALVILIGHSVSNFNQLFALVMSVCGPTLQLFLPIFLSFRIRHRLGAKMSSGFRRVAHFLIVLLGVFTLTIGFSMSIKDIVESE
mmetsp:Transcript_99998/g.137625  ORF Transcript_99998/g.137625 Transcript_99998/m.137625 type:complete len:493 (-) Transcript_99998:226-1704(-)